MQNSAGPGFTRGAAVVLLVLLMGAMSTAGALHLSCSITAPPAGPVQYQLSPELPQNCTHQGWEVLPNKTVIALGSEVDQELVLNLTRQTLTLNKCLSHIHFTSDCDGFVEAHCKFNCSSLRPLKPPPVEPPEKMVVLLALVLAVAAGLAFRWFVVPQFRRCRRRSVQDRATEDIEQETKEPLTDVISV